MVLRPTRHKNRSSWRRSSQPISWLATKKLKQTQQKQTCIRNNIKLTPKLKPGLVASYDIRPGNGEDLFWLQRFINVSLTYLPEHLPTAPGPTRGTDESDAVIGCKMWQTPFHNNTAVSCQSTETVVSVHLPALHWQMNCQVFSSRNMLAQRPWPGVFQASSYSSPVSERRRTTVPVGLLRSSSRWQHSMAPAFRQLSLTCSTSLPAHHLQPSCLFSCWPQSLELSPGFHLGHHHQGGLFQTFA